MSLFQDTRTRNKQKIESIYIANSYLPINRLIVFHNKPHAALTRDTGKSIAQACLMFFVHAYVMFS